MAERPSDLLPLREVAQRLGVREGTLRQWRLRGQGPKSEKVGVAVAYRRRVIEKWEDAQREEAETA